MLFMAKNTISERVESHMANICAGLLFHLLKLLENDNVVVTASHVIIF